MIIDRIKKAYNDGDRSSLVFKNVINSFGIKSIGILISLMLIPLSITYVGPVEYGIWLTVSSVVGWMNQFDFGLGNGLRNQLTTDYSHKNHGTSRMYISSTYAILILISVAFFIIFIFFHQIIDWASIFNIPEDLAPFIDNIVIIVLISFCAQFVLQLIITILTAVHMNYKGNLIMTFALVLSIFGMVFLYYFTESNLTYLVLVLAFAPVVSMIIFTLFYFRFDLKMIKPSFKVIEIKKSKGLINAGWMFFIIQLCTLALYQTSNLIIANVLSLEDVSVYNVVYKYFTALFMVVMVILNPYWTGFAEAFELNDFVWIKKSMIFLRKIFFYFIGMNFICVMISPFVFKFWIGDRLEIPFYVTLFLGIYFLAFYWYNSHLVLINGVGKLKVQVITILICSLVNIPLSIAFGKIFGLNGVIVANSLVLAFLGLITYIQSEKIINEKATGIWFR